VSNIEPGRFQTEKNFLYTNNTVTNKMRKSAFEDQKDYLDLIFIQRIALEYTFR